MTRTAPITTCRLSVCVCVRGCVRVCVCVRGCVCVCALTGPPGVRVFEGEGQAVVNGCQFDDGLFNHHPVCFLHMDTRLG